MTPQNGEKQNGTLPVVLLVENDEISKEVTEIFLKDICEVEFASDGNIALEKAKEKQYDAFLMDINLGTGLSGVDVTKELRKFQEYQDTPIIALTAFAMKGDKEEFIASGCTDYLSKPFDKETLVEIMQNALPGRIPDILPDDF